MQLARGFFEVHFLFTDDVAFGATKLVPNHWITANCLTIFLNRIADKHSIGAYARRNLPFKIGIPRISHINFKFDQFASAQDTHTQKQTSKVLHADVFQSIRSCKLQFDARYALQPFVL